jgi:hypothetical protein
VSLPGILNIGQDIAAVKAFAVKVEKVLPSLEADIRTVLGAIPRIEAALAKLAPLLALVPGGAPVLAEIAVAETATNAVTAITSTALDDVDLAVAAAESEGLPPVPAKPA